MRKVYIVKGRKIINDQWVAPEVLREPPTLFVESPEGKDVIQDPDSRQKVRVSRLRSGLVMIDPDAPKPEEPFKSPILHWLNLSELPGGGNEVPYMGPHPPPDSNPHRYIFYQLGGNLEKDFSFLHTFEEKRAKFPLDLLRQLGLTVKASGQFFSSQH